MGTKAAAEPQKATTTPRSAIDLTTSVISMDERRAHAVEIQETAERHSVQRAEIDRRAEEFDAYDPQIRPGA